MFFKKREQKNSPIDFIVAGLGNPGDKYDLTRHNIGFMTVDYLAEQYHVKLTKLKCKALMGTAKIGDKTVLLVKPQTFMNNSGESLREVLAFYKRGVEDMIVICDDISLPEGKLRIRRKGSDGGHNGLKSIIYHLHSDGFVRVKMGVGAKPHPDYDLAAWVLSRFKGDEIKKMESAVVNTADAVRLITAKKKKKAMNLYNA